jgi:hypothetical protein
MNGTRIENQVYICFDGPDGLVMQVTYETFLSYYRLLGWELLGPANPMAGFAQRHGAPVAAGRRERNGYASNRPSRARPDNR